MRALLLLAVVALAILGAFGLYDALSERTRPERDAGRVSASAPVTESPDRTPDATSRDSVPPVRPQSDVSAAPMEPTGPLDDEMRLENEAGIDALAAGNNAEAVRRFERCFEARPEEPAYAFNLSEALARLALEEYGNGNRERALELLERAHLCRNDREDIARLLRKWREESKAESELWSYETDHFELAFDAQRDDLLYGAQDVLDVLEAAYLEFALEFGVDPVARGRARVRVTITSRPDFQRATGLGEWAGGAFDGTIRMPMSDLTAERGEWERVLRHELVHVYVREVGGREVPGWLNEGLSQWLEGGRAALLRRARGRLEGRELFSLERMTGSLIHWDDGEQVARAYAQAVLLVDAIALTYGAAVVFDMVRACSQGKDPGDVFEQRTLVPLSVVFDGLVVDLSR